MKQPIAITLAALFGMALVQPVMAGHGHAAPGLERIEQRQEQMIRQGVRQGDLTRREQKLIDLEQRRLDSMEREFRKDGRLSKKERFILRQRYEKAGQHIRLLVRNDERRRDAHGHHRAGRDHHERPSLGFWYRGDDDWLLGGRR